MGGEPISLTQYYHVQQYLEFVESYLLNSLDHQQQTEQSPLSQEVPEVLAHLELRAALEIQGTHSLPLDLVLQQDPAFQAHQQIPLVQVFLDVQEVQLVLVHPLDLEVPILKHTK